MNALDVEIAVTNHFGHIKNVIVPNIYTGLNLNYEVDLVILRTSNYAIEVEIKVSKADLIAERKKGKYEHYYATNEESFKSYRGGGLFRYSYFAVPEDLVEFALKNIPETAGLLSVRGETFGDTEHFGCKEIKRPVPSHKYKFTERQRNKLLELGCMRIDRLNRTIQKIRNKK